MFHTFRRKHWDIFSIYVIPIFTILLACTDGWVATNLSVIAYSKNKEFAFIVWGVLSAWYFNAYIWHLFKLVNFKGRIGISFLQAATLSLIFAVLTPYLPEQFPQKAKYHILFAFFSPILLLGCFICFHIYLEGINQNMFRRARYELLAMVIVSLGLLYRLGFVSSLLEIFISVSVCYFLRKTHKRIEVLQLEKPKVC